MRIFPTLFKTGRHAARRAKKLAEAEMQLAKEEREALQAEQKQIKRKANQLKIRSMRSRRSSAYFQQGEEGRATIG